VGGGASGRGARGRGLATPRRDSIVGRLPAHHQAIGSLARAMSGMIWFHAGSKNTESADATGRKIDVMEASSSDSQRGIAVLGLSASRPMASAPRTRIAAPVQKHRSVEPVSTMRRHSVLGGSPAVGEVMSFVRPETLSGSRCRGTYTISCRIG